jgi:hypothetical protein
MNLGFLMACMWGEPINGIIRPDFSIGAPQRIKPVSIWTPNGLRYWREHKRFIDSMLRGCPGAPF